MINLDDLDDDQRAAATAPRGPVCIIAGAGTGKTRTITYRIANLIDQGFVAPQRVLAVTFTARAAGEMRERLNHMGIGGVQARTFHAAARRQLSYFWPSIAGNLQWKLIDNKFPLVGRAVRSVGLDNSTDMVRDVLSEIEWAKATLLTPETYVQAAQKHSDRRPPADPEKIAAAYRRYEEMKTTDEGMLLDFDDLLLHTAAALENTPGVAEEFREQYRSFVVDEYQDVTPLQQRVLDGWLGERDDITVVGDAHQTIYSFTGATPDYLLNFSRRYPHAAVKLLQRDYRSTPHITDLANTVISRAHHPGVNNRIPMLKLQGMRPQGPKPTFSSHPDEVAEARDVAAKIKKLISQGVQPSEIAVLYRINAQSARYEEIFQEESIAYQVRGGEGFYQRAEIREALSALARAVDVSDIPVDEVVSRTFIPLGLTPEEPQGERARERWQSLKALKELIGELAPPDMPTLISQLRQRAEAKHPPTMNSVTLASMHAAKGLEWDAVFLVGLVEGSVPISHAIKSGTDYAIEEERRLFYVGITRARAHLYLSWSAARQEGGRATRKRTRFLDGIVADAPEQRTSKVSASRIRYCTECGEELTTPAEKVLRRCATHPGGADEEVFQALRAWRKDIAQDQGVPAFVVFSDATLLALAEALPTTKEAMLEVSGVGPVKVDAYGDGVLETLAQFT